MTETISRKMAVDCLLWRLMQHNGELAAGKTQWGLFLECGVCHCPVEPEQAIQFDHIHADVFDGPHEYQNLRPVHTDCHKKKTKADIQANAKIKRLTGKTKGRKKVKIPSRKMQSGRKLQSRPFQKKAK